MTTVWSYITIIKNKNNGIGGYGVGSVTTILKFNPASNEWEKTGELSIARYYHAVAVLPMKDVKPYCS